MDATERIAIEFDRLNKLGRTVLVSRPKAERIVCYVVSARCAIDIGGFAVVYEQEFSKGEIEFLIDSFECIAEYDLANHFRHCHNLLNKDGLYEHMDWNRVSNVVKDKLETTGTQIGEQLWALDDKLAKLLDNPTTG